MDADKCVGCGTCVEVCPHGNYKFGNRGLETNGECDYCMSCVHNCPQKAITFKPSDNFMLRPEPNPNARFRNPNVTLADIKRANRQ
ncbi:MAG: 4Fe-4S binding protein [Bacteroidales bacterium]